MRSMILVDNQVGTTHRDAAGSLPRQLTAAGHDERKPVEFIVILCMAQSARLGGG
jgi:hypothetical protein